MAETGWDAPETSQTLDVGSNDSWGGAATDAPITKPTSPSTSPTRGRGRTSPRASFKGGRGGNQPRQRRTSHNDDRARNGVNGSSGPKAAFNQGWDVATPSQLQTSPETADDGWGHTSEATTISTSPAAAMKSADQSAPTTSTPDAAAAEQGWSSPHHDNINGNAHLGDSAQTPGLDPTAVAFEPKGSSPVIQQNGESQSPKEKRDARPHRKEVYVNPDRVETGGMRKAKLSPEELEEKMKQARERNAALVKKREVVDADEAEWRQKEAETKKAQEEERLAREARNQRLREVQNSVDEARARNAARKMEKLANRQWDALKDPKDFDPASGGSAVIRSDDAPEEDLSQYMWNSRGRGRGRGGGRGAGRGRGRGMNAGQRPLDVGDRNEFPSGFV